jgi:hypothetical protein
MRNLPTLIFSTVFLAASLPAAAYAVDPPVGSYQKTSTVQSFSNSLLIASCHQDNNPNYRVSQIDVRHCGAEIFNRDGGLQCFAKQGFGIGRAIPRGSYVDSCKDIAVATDQKSISAQCKDREGNYRNTNLSTSGCSVGGEFDNNNGVLVCGVPKPGQRRGQK